MHSIKMYSYEGCGTCRKALKFLDHHNITAEVLPIRETPPSLIELKQMAAHYKGSWRKLFNTSGLDYKAMQLKDKLPTMTENDALKLLAGNGRLVKRPFVLHGKTGWVGFDEAEWKQRLGV